MATTADLASPVHPLTRALARWENEGGAVDAASGEMLSQEERHILQCLGAAVIAVWTELPTEVQRALFIHAAASGDPRQSADLREQIARFLHTHKDSPSGPPPAEGHADESSRREGVGFPHRQASRRGVAEGATAFPQIGTTWPQSEPSAGTTRR